MITNYIRMVDVVSLIMSYQISIPSQKAVLVAISGIDGSGKGYITKQLVRELEEQNLRVANVNVDGWLRLPDRRFSEINPSSHFYDYAIRFKELFSELVFPLRSQGSIYLEADYAEETATEYQKRIYEFNDIDVILLEGIFLLKRCFVAFYDLSFWVDCSFETALERAISRSQEGLTVADTIKAYETIYFPAQRIHFELDDPQKAVTAIINNDPRLIND